MKHETETAPPAPLGQVERGVGRPAPERAAYDAWYAAATFETMGHEWTWAGWRAGSEWQRAQAPTLEDAHAMGANGGPALEAERLAFEAWMRGHCWALCARWDGKQYRSDDEASGDVNPHAMRTRQLWAAWRDRAALARGKTPNVAANRTGPACRDRSGLSGVLGGW